MKVKYGPTGAHYQDLAQQGHGKGLWMIWINLYLTELRGDGGRLF